MPRRCWEKSPEGAGFGDGFVLGVGLFCLFGLGLLWLSLGFFECFFGCFGGGFGFGGLDSGVMDYNSQTSRSSIDYQTC